MKKLLLSLFVLAFIGIASALQNQLGVVPQVRAAVDQTLTMDVAFDGRTVAGNPADPAAKEGARGEVTLTLLGFNSTGGGFENYRFVFTLK